MHPFLLIVKPLEISSDEYTFKADFANGELLYAHVHCVVCKQCMFLFVCMWFGMFLCVQYLNVCMSVHAYVRVCVCVCVRVRACVPFYHYHR